MEVKIAAGAFGRARNCGWDGLQYHGWACSSAVSAWKQGVLKRKCLSIKYPNVLAILSYFWLISPIVRHCTAYGGSNRSKEVRWENLSWHKHRSKHRLCHMARAGTSEHLNMLFFGKKICVWRYVSPYYLLEFTTFAVDHDPNASFSYTWKPLNCRLKRNKCYYFIVCCFSLPQQKWQKEFL